ncbi:MAG: tetratricopeptide repeat protein [Phycisphaerales bacterium]
MSTPPAKPTASPAPAPSASPGGAAPAATPAAGAVGAAAGGAGAPVRRTRPRVDWKAVWPIPLALTAAAGLTFGLFTAVARAPKADPGVPLKQAHAAYDEARYTDALEIINAELVPYINGGKLTEEQEKDFFALRARSLYYGQERMGISQVENYKAITDAYEQGRRRGMVTEPADVGNLAESYLYTGDVDKAVDLARLLEGRDEERRLRLFERIITQEMKEGSSRYPLVLGLLNDMLLKQDLPIERRAWAVTRQAQIRLDAGFAQEAISRLLRELPKFESLPKEVRADLLFILGKAYADGVDDQMAMTTLEQAMRCLLEQENAKDGKREELRIDRFDPRIGEALVIQGRIFARNGQIEEARERFQTVRESFKDSNVYAQALLGEADTSAELSDFDGALALYSQAADRVAAAGPTPATPGIAAVTLDLIGSKLMDHHDRRVLENDPAESLHFVRKAQEVYQRLGVVPSAVYLAAAKANRLNAQMLLREAAGLSPTDPAPRPEDVSQVTAVQAKGFLLDAGQNFRDHARAIGDSNNNAHMDSLLAAGDCFDQAGDTAAAIEAYSTFMSGDAPIARGALRRCSGWRRSTRRRASSRPRRGTTRT